MRQGLQDKDLLLYFQPQVNSAGCIIGAEALMRWQHPERGIVFPTEFVPLAEETGLILPLGRWALQAACAQLVAWARHPDTARLVMAVNVSARQFHHPDFVEEVLAVLKYTGADPKKQIDRAYRLALCRPPARAEAEAMLEFLQKEADNLRREAAGKGRPLAAADARRRALEQLCRVVFNLNEFVYAD